MGIYLHLTHSPSHSLRLTLSVSLSPSLHLTLSVSCSPSHTLHLIFFIVLPSLFLAASPCLSAAASLSPSATKFFQRHLFSFLFFRGLRNSSLSFVKQSSSFSSKTINKIGKNLCCSAESYRSCNMQHANGCFFAKLFT